MEEDNLPSGKSDRLLIKALCFLYKTGRFFHYFCMQQSETFQKQKCDNARQPRQEEQIHSSCVNTWQESNERTRIL